MIHKLTEQVWFGNWEAPFECIGKVGTIINIAHHFSPRHGRDVYWSKLKELPHHVLYFRLSKKDREDVDAHYMSALCQVVHIAFQSKKLPILTHCQLGGHRGPTSAIIAAWELAGRGMNDLQKLHARALQLVPGLARGRNYYHSSMDIMGEWSVDQYDEESSGS
jgi:hypothetical protein